MEPYSSKLLADAIEQFSSLPGIGKRTAMRLALFILNQEKEEVRRFSAAMVNLKEQVKFCSSCFNLSEEPVCSICANPHRDEKTLCIVEDIRDVIAIENTGQFRGKYHVLGGKISPMDGIGPADLRIEELVERVNESEVSEVIMALSTTMEGDTTNFYLYKRLKDASCKISTIARGVSIGDELEYADELTLGRSVLNRVPYETTFVR